ncbi:MAG: alpha/beta hydrolase, partial [Flavobacterium sp.]|uniref:serine aminopeptidase domain-containing protein n=1 Tax=Flavobacterium sp. TaxID=239 RepID=UPI001205A766
MQTLALQTPNGYSIAVRHFAAVGDSIVVIAPATGVPQKFYSNFATWLSQNGVSVVTFDYCGIAESKPDKLTDADCDAVDWGANDLETAIHFAVDGFSEKKVVLIGHSIG